MILIDTNVLVYAVNTAAPQHEESRAFVEAARGGDFPAVLVPQVLLKIVNRPRPWYNFPGGSL